MAGKWEGGRVGWEREMGGYRGMGGWGGVEGMEGDLRLLIIET